MNICFNFVIMEKKKISILVIEDDTRMAELIIRGLTDYGYNPTHVDDGKRGLRMAIEHRYDMVITDILLPGMNGLDVCKQLRWVLIIIFFEILIPPEPFMRDAPHFFYRKYNKNLL
jgi:response regulator RpfG family c-di-GMP phosphodiesterase